MKDDLKRASPELNKPSKTVINFKRYKKKVNTKELLPDNTF